MMNTNWCGSEKSDGIDRISSLPDDVRTHILSFLSTREAVQTCILSKGWINMWAFVPDLKFDIEEFGLREIVDIEMAVVEVLTISASNTRTNLTTKFELLLRSVLEKRETSCVNRFQLWLDSAFRLPWTRALADCIADVMKLGPRECLVQMGSCENLNLNTDVIFTCASLIYLELGLSTDVDHYVAIEPNSVNLPCLKTLNLYGVTMSNDSFKKVLLRCPVLEELELQGCSIGIIEICSNTLKKLVLRHCYDVMRLQISTPNLLYLDIYVGTRDILLLNMPSVVDASIYIPGWCDGGKYVTRLPKLIHSLSNAESLWLDLGCHKLQKAQIMDFSKCPVFNNLKRLKMVNSGFYDFDLAFSLLHYSPKLQELTVSNCHESKFLDQETTLVGPRDALVKREFLKTVIILGFKNDNDRLINNLLAHVKIIGDIIIDDIEKMFNEVHS